MPEKPEVITVCNKLKQRLIGKKFKNIQVLYKPIIQNIDVNVFINNLKNQTINDIDTRGKWIVFHLDKYVLLVHLRMEGKFYYRNINDPIEKHQHVIFTFEDNEQLRFVDTRKFGKMALLDKKDYLTKSPLKELGLEFFDKNLDKEYLKKKYKNKSIPIKTALLDQTIIAGIGNIYADEVLFMSKINPYTSCKKLTEQDLEEIIINTKKVLKKAIKEGGTTIRSYTSEEGVTGLFQNSLLVHAKENKNCPVCNNKIIKVRINGRGTYYCPVCQQKRD